MTYDDIPPANGCAQGVLVALLLLALALFAAIAIYAVVTS